jgi:hypothetical protein
MQPAYPVNYPYSSISAISLISRTNLVELRARIKLAMHIRYRWGHSEHENTEDTLI